KCLFASPVPLVGCHPEESERAQVKECPPREPHKECSESVSRRSRRHSRRKFRNEQQNCFTNVTKDRNQNCENSNDSHQPPASGAGTHRIRTCKPGLPDRF